MRRFLRSTALALLFSGVLPFAAPDIFVYRSAMAANSDGLPDWIQASCCGPADAHKLRVDQVHDMGSVYIIDDYQYPIEKVVTHFGSATAEPNSVIKPSGDGSYWIFYSDNSRTGGYVSPPYCFFVPMNF